MKLTNKQILMIVVLGFSGLIAMFIIGAATILAAKARRRKATNANAD